MQSLKLYFLPIIIIVFSITLCAQFSEVNIDIKADKLPQKERYDLKTLQRDLKTYFTNYKWIENTYGIDIPLNINLFPQSVNNTGFERVFTGQLLITPVSGDQRIFEKNFKFVYNTNDPLLHSDMFHSLTTALDFFAYLLIAGELDTYDPLGGNNIYSKARDIASRALVSERPTGWKDRINDLDEIVRIRNYRLFKYYYWAIFDKIDSDETKQVIELIDKALNYLEDTFSVNARERNTHIFLDAHARDFILNIKDFGTTKQAEKLISLDQDNKKLYRTILDQKD